MKKDGKGIAYNKKVREHINKKIEQFEVLGKLKGKDRKTLGRGQGQRV